MLKMKGALAIMENGTKASCLGAA